ncbi:MAG TPA: hypothetical protein VLR88_08705, partial [Propionibacteriaceae bacterium]|nr:hypothetical protein [Propionibacteriaceae bacterium]
MGPTLERPDARVEAWGGPPDGPVLRALRGLEELPGRRGEVVVAILIKALSLVLIVAIGYGIKQLG